MVFIFFTISLAKERENRVFTITIICSNSGMDSDMRKLRESFDLTGPIYESNSPFFSIEVHHGGHLEEDIELDLIFYSGGQVKRKRSKKAATSQSMEKNQSEVPLLPASMSTESSRSSNPESIISMYQRSFRSPSNNQDAGETVMQSQRGFEARGSATQAVMSRGNKVFFSTQPQH